jgi:hypothetical protein
MISKSESIKRETRKKKQRSEEEEAKTETEIEKKGNTKGEEIRKKKLK